MRQIIHCVRVWVFTTSIAQSCSAVTIKPGDIVVVDELGSSLFVVDKSTGDRTVISSASVGTGPVMDRPLELAFEAGETALVTEASADSLFRVNLANGNREIVSSAAIGSGPTFGNLYAVSLA